MNLANPWCIYFHIVALYSYGGAVEDRGHLVATLIGSLVVSMRNGLERFGESLSNCIRIRRKVQKLESITKNRIILRLKRVSTKLR